MLKENNCSCVVCQVERNLLNSLGTQIARTHFQALAHNYPILNHFDSPSAVIAQLHEHERVELVNHKTWNGILHALVNSIGSRTAEEIGQQLLLLAYMPAIHKAYREVCQKFPALYSEDIAQQAAVCFLETARSPEMQSLNGHLPAALARRFRQSLFRWAINELRQSLPLEQIGGNVPETAARNFEEGVILELLLSKAQRMGVLSAGECELVRKFHCDGFHRNELTSGEGGPSARALYFRVYRTVTRLRRLGRGEQPVRGTQAALSNKHSQNSSSDTQTFSGEMCIRNSEKGFSPERSHPGSHLQSDVPSIAA